MAELSQKELNLIAYTLLGEAAGEGREGMEAVMWTIRNRAESGRFSSNPANVATQKSSKGVYQYSTWNTKGDGGNSPKSRFASSSPEFKEALAVVQRVMAGDPKTDPTKGATHFYAEGSTKPGWFDAEGPGGEVKIGNHRFAARNTAADTARTASDAAELLANGRLAPRPQSPISAYAPEVPARRPDSSSTQSSESSPTSSSGLTSRSVSTVPINPSTGMPYPRLTPQPANSVQPKREAVRLSEMRTMPSNAADLTGNRARTSSTNAAAIDKQPRVADRTGPAARTVTVNQASASKTDRGASTSVAARPAVVAQNKSVQQIGQEIDNARMSGYRDIQAMGPSSKGAPPKAAPKTSGVTKTAGTVLSDGTRLAQAGDVQLPRDVRPKIEVPKAPTPKPVTQFIKPVQATPAQVKAATPFALPALQTPPKSSIIKVADDDSKRLPKSDLPKLAASGSAGAKRKEGQNEQALQRKAGVTKTATVAPTIKPAAPTLREVVAVRNLPPRRPEPIVKGGMQVRTNGTIIPRQVPVIAPPQRTVAQMIASQFYSNGVANPAYRDYNYTYQSEGGGLMPANSYGGNGGGGFVDSLGSTYYDRHLK